MPKTFTVIVKDIYTYSTVEADSKEQAIDKVVAQEWPHHDEPLETEATLNKEE